MSLGQKEWTYMYEYHWERKGESCINVIQAEAGMYE